MCNRCTSWEHESSDCYSKAICRAFKTNHIQGACSLQQLINCAAVVKNIAKLCMQDISIDTGKRFKKANSSTARVLFDLGSQTTLIRDMFAEQVGWRYSKADYSLAGIGTSATTIRDRLWNIILMDSCG